MGGPAEVKAEQHGQTVPAGALPPWDVGELPPPPSGRGWRIWAGLLGPGVVLAAIAIGSGEWLLGPAVTAQYGAALLWLATLSIVFQVFCNLMMMRYAVYCGEPILVGGMRTWPGPRLWVVCYLLLDIAALFPYNAANAAVPLVAAIRGRLPGAEDVALVKVLGYAIFLLAFVPLIFGGTVYRTIERIMTFKLVYVLGFLTITAVLMVSASVWWEVTSGFFRFGAVPLRADTIVVGPHFHILEEDGNARYFIRGTVEDDKPTVAEFGLERGSEKQSYKLGQPIPDDLRERYREMRERAA